MRAFVNKFVRACCRMFFVLPDFKISFMLEHCHEGVLVVAPDYVAMHGTWTKSVGRYS